MPGLGRRSRVVLVQREARVQPREEREDDAVAERDERERAHVDLRARGLQERARALAALRGGGGGRAVRLRDAGQRREDGVGLEREERLGERERGR